MTKAIALVRVSSEAQAGADRGGLPRQRVACQEIATRHGLEIVEWVELEGVSGASVLGSAAFRRMLARLDEPEIAGIVVDDVSRLMRPERISDYQILEAFRGTGKLLYTRDGARDVRSFGGRMLSLLQGELSAYERSEITRRTSAGRERKRRLQGVRAEGGPTPRGVAFDHPSGRWSYVFPEAERVREAFRLWLSSDGTLPFAEIARRTGIGSGTATNGSWAISSLLRQPLYRGVYRVDRRWVNDRPVPRAPEDCYEHQVIDPPLVPAADWHRAQELLAGRARRRPPRRDPELQDGIYARVLECSSCGTHLWQSPGGMRATRWGPHYAHAAYRCPERGCATGYTSIRLADPIVDEALAARLGAPEVLERLLTESQAELERRAPAVPTDATRRLTELANREARAKEGYLSGAFDLRELAKVRAAIDGERGALEALLAREDGPVEIDQDVVAAIVDVFASWRVLERAQKRAMLRDFQIRVRVRKPLAPPGKRAKLEVASIRLGVFRDDFSVYK